MTDGEFKAFHEIKVCPFCGSNAKVCETDENIFNVICDECVSFGPSASREITAIVLWNNRVVQ